MYQENPEKDFFDEVMDLIGADSKDSAAAAVRGASQRFLHTRHTRFTFFVHVTLRRRAVPPTSELHL